MFVSVHIPKCAGTSFRHILQERCGSRLWLNYGNIFVRAQARREYVPPGTEWIHGHFFADAFDDLFPDRKLLTWMRHPVERVASNYYHFLRSPDMRDDCCRAIYDRNLTLAEFAELDWMRNEAARYLAGKPISDFTFVGVANQFEASLRVLAARVGWSDRIETRTDNVNPARQTEAYDLLPVDRDRILKLNQADLELYDAAVDRLKNEFAELETYAA